MPRTLMSPRPGIARTRALAAVAVLALGLPLAGCIPTPSSPTPTVTLPVETPSSTPTPTTPALADDVLFVITTTATESDGGVAELTETVHAPVDATGISAAVADAIDADCGDVGATYPDPRYLVGDVTATGGGDSEWTNEVGVDLGGSDGDHISAPVTWSGDFDTFQAFCATVTPKVPGTLTGTAVVFPDPTEDGGWAMLRYGFGSTDSSVTFSDCALQPGPAGLAAFPELQTWTPDTGTADESCFFGG